MNINEMLKKEADPKYLQFQVKICQSKYPIMGVKIPIVRKIAKNLLKEYHYKEILKNINNEYFESLLLEAFIIANAKTNIKEKIDLITQFLPKIDNWALCDTFCAELKVVKESPEEFLNFILPLLKENDEFKSRFALVILLNFYINDKYLFLVLDSSTQVISDAFYTKMANAWLLATSLTKYFPQTLQFLKDNQNKYDKWTYNKALQKARESIKISNEQKEILKKMKI